MKSTLATVLTLTLSLPGCAGTPDTPATDASGLAADAVADAGPRDWAGRPVPVDPPTGQVWKLDEQTSDDFNYAAPADDKGAAFGERWIDMYHNHWRGPGLTAWREDHSDVADGHLHIRASRKEGTDKVNIGIISSKYRVQYPVYIEGRAKVSNSVLATAMWLLSPDDTQEIDFMEAYGASHSANAPDDKKDQSWFAHRMHVSHHVFIREPFQDYQPKDAGAWIEADTPWREDFHTYGVYWRDPWHLEYYIDGELVRTTSGEDMIDPEGFTGGKGLHKAMDIILDSEDHDWRSDQGVTPSDEELANAEDHVFKVDWLRVYKLVAAD